MNKVVCFDLDDTIFDFLGSFIPYMQKYAPILIPRLKNADLSGGARNWRNWSGYRDFGLTDEEFQVVFKEFTAKGEHRCLRPYTDSIGYYTDQLIDAGWDIVFVTKRPVDVIWQSVAALRDDLGIKFKSLYHVGRKNDTVVYDYKTNVVLPAGNLPEKYDVFKILDAYAVFDDHPEYILQAKKAGVKHLYFINRSHNENWRRRNKKNHPDIKFVKRKFLFLREEIMGLVNAK